jgi:hypothetical protein
MPVENRFAPQSAINTARQKAVIRVAEKVFVRLVTDTRDDHTLHARLDRAFDAAELFVSRAWRYTGVE